MTGATANRVRCPVCGQYPTLTKEGALRGHTYPWYHSQSGDSCPGTGTQITPLAGQTSLEDIEIEQAERRIKFQQDLDNLHPTEGK